MKTEPQLPAGDAPIDEQTLQRLLDGVSPDMVVVGGQALAFWMRRFGISTAGGRVSNDADLIGNLDEASALARRMGARLMTPEKTARTALVAQLRLPSPRGDAVNIDVLHMLFTVGGLKKSGVFTRRVVARSIQVAWGDGRHIRVMEPFDVLESRVHNAAGLVRVKGPHVVTQARWAVDIAKAALLTLAAEQGEFKSRLGAKIQQVFRLATSAPGRRVLREHRIDVLEAIDADLLEAMAPECLVQLTAVRNEQAHRETGLMALIDD